MGQWEALELDRGSGTPLYLQLAEGIRGLIVSGQLGTGERLPPSRDLAGKLGVNRNTVTAAYEELVRRGSLRSRVGQGTFVLERTGDASPAPPLRFHFSRAIEAVSEGVRPKPVLAAEHADPIDFATLVPDEDLFPIRPFRRVVDRVLATEGKKLLQYGPAAGYPPLREYIAERLRERGVVTDPENVLIVNGSQQGLDLICRTLLDPGDRVAVESPTYTIVHPLLAQYHARIEPVPMTDRGMDLEALRGALERSRPKLVFTTPTFHNPTGITMDLDSRRRLLELCSRYEAPVVEDDYDSDLRFDGESLPTLLALDDRGAVLHIGTFSKGLFPGLRLGWIVAPRPAAAALGRSKLISDYHTSLLLQAAVLEFCREGHYDRHLKKLAAICREKSETLMAALEEHFPAGVRWTRPQGGYAFWVTLPDGVPAEEVLEESSRAGVLFTPGTHFFARGEGERHFRLSISRVPSHRIVEGVKKLGEILARRIRGVASNRPARLGHPEPALHI